MLTNMVDISLIKNWHEKAKEDYFSRYIFEYLAFEAFLKKYKYSEDEIRHKSGNIKERSYIQNIKNDADYSSKWSELLTNKKDFKKVVQELTVFLQNEPLVSDVNWWSCTSFDYGQCPTNNPKGIIVNETDFVNVVEFWYQVRNNLFHAGKNPDNKRDEKLVAYAYATLSVFFEDILLPEIEQRTMHPAIWEEFEHKFFTGKAEAMVKVGNSDACANVYELLFTDEKFFPLILNGKQIDRAYIIDKLSFNLTNLYGDPYLLKEEWDNITRRARTPEDKAKIAEYFSSVIPLVKDAIPDLEV